MGTFSPTSMFPYSYFTTYLLVSQGLDGIEHGRPVGRIKTENQAGTDRGDNPDGGPEGGHLGGQERNEQANNNVTAAPTTMPRTPPTAVSIIASKRNCLMICRRVAPIAFRTPISRVRSVTETNMMLMTPTPPTTRATDEIASITAKMPS